MYYNLSWIASSTQAILWPMEVAVKTTAEPQTVLEPVTRSLSSVGKITTPPVSLMLPAPVYLVQHQLCTLMGTLSLSPVGLLY